MVGSGGGAAQRRVLRSRKVAPSAAKWPSNKPQQQYLKRHIKRQQDKIANPLCNPTPPPETNRRLAEPTNDMVATATDPSPPTPTTLSPRFHLQAATLSTL
ncbi:hypothetical protein J6590_040125 [Homalodisca vitripennis]|nr:hypothetical protein J6590_040125 [Homalodisca vitripennis]